MKIISHPHNMKMLRGYAQEQNFFGKDVAYIPDASSSYSVEFAKGLFDTKRKGLKRYLKTDIANSVFESLCCLGLLLYDINILTCDTIKYGYFT